MAKQGKCEPCRKIWRWPLDVPLGNAKCPGCGCLLKRTASRKWATLPTYNVTNSDIECHPMKRRTPKTINLPDLHAAEKETGPKIGPGTD